jgi:hypothetical protein
MPDRCLLRVACCSLHLHKQLTPPTASSQQPAASSQQQQQALALRFLRFAVCGLWASWLGHFLLSTLLLVASC